MALASLTARLARVSLTRLPRISASVRLVFVVAYVLCSRRECCCGSSGRGGSSAAAPFLCAIMYYHLANKHWPTLCVPYNAPRH
jgi:hypothetical protein